MASLPPIPELLPAEQAPPLVRLEKHLGVTGVGSIWLGRLLEGDDAGRVVSVRRIEKRWLSEMDVARAVTSACAYAKVRHPSLVKLIGVFEQGDDLLCISEHLSGVRLVDLVRRVIDDGVPLPATVALRIVLDAAHATWKAHALASEIGLFPVERLFLPEGVLLTGFGGTLLTEVGLLATLARSNATRSVPELLAQLAPEELSAPTDVGGSTEVFSLGVILWELLANRRLFSRDCYNQTHQDLLSAPIRTLNGLERFGLPVPEAIVSLVHKATERNPSNRFSSVDEFAVALGRLPAQFIASERQVLDVLRQRAGGLLKESTSQLSEPTLSDPVTECHSETTVTGHERSLDEGWDLPDTTSAEHWEKPTFAQRSLVSGPPIGTSVSPVCTTNQAASAADVHSRVNRDEAPSQRRAGLLITTLTMLCTAAVVFLARDVSGSRIARVGRGSAVAGTPLSADYLPKLVPSRTLAMRPIAAGLAKGSALARSGLTPDPATGFGQPLEPMVRVEMDTVKAAPVKSAAQQRQRPAAPPKTTKASRSTAPPVVDTRWGI